MINNRSKGFTLIELLVVIAIIGILSAVVLASLQSARQKGQDAAVQSNLATIQTEAELYYGGAGNNSYGSATAQAGCTTAATLFVNDTTIKQAIAAAAASASGGTVACYFGTSPSGYAVSAALTSKSGYYFCVDSTGAATTTLGSTIGSKATCN